MNMSLDEVKRLSAENHQKLIVVQGIIYDVGNSISFQKKAPYSIYIGHDATVCLAKMSLDKEYLDKTGDIQLTDQEQRTLKEWIVYYDKSYRRVGKILNDTKDD